MQPPRSDPTSKDDLQRLLGYLNFSEGRPDAGFQRTFARWQAQIVPSDAQRPLAIMHDSLQQALADLHQAGVGPFRDVHQAAAAIDVVFNAVLPAYRKHHEDLLFHLSDAELFQPFFIVRVIETMLELGVLSDDRQQLINNALRRLNDYVGHRPIAILETRPRGEPYDHERVRPIPLYIQQAGVAPGRYQELIEQALSLIRAADPTILSDACFDPDLLDELAIDPRPYDHSHPANRRPNYVFGEWDPHLIDNRGFYRRFVVRPLILDALMQRVEEIQNVPRAELLSESAAACAGIILMASGVSGNGPGTHDSSTTLAQIVPRIAQYRDAFYARLLEAMKGEHGQRLRQEALRLRQPFGGVRQYLNQYLARSRAMQLQQRHLALLMAEIGYPETSRHHARRIPAVSLRMLSEIYICLTTCQRSIEMGKLTAAGESLTMIEEMLLRGIACGAVVDPWNILGFGGLFPLFQSMEDAIQDPRIPELVAIVERTLSLYARSMSEAAATGQQPLVEQLSRQMRRFAMWWDQFATAEVSETRPVRGDTAVDSAAHVSRALHLWHERGQRAADLGFWRQHLEGFRSTKAYALVVESLLQKEDYRAAMGLLMHWLSQHDEVSLEDGDYQFHTLAVRWMLTLCRGTPQTTADTRSGTTDLIVRFIDHLEANADDYWNVPELDVSGNTSEEDEDLLEGEDNEESELFEAAYEGVTFKDTFDDDDNEAEVLDVDPHRVFDLELEAERLQKHLRFLATVARLWNIAARACGFDHHDVSSDQSDHPLVRWYRQADLNYEELLDLLDIIHLHPIPEPTGAIDSMMEYDRHRAVKEQLLHTCIGTTLEMWLARGALLSRITGERLPQGWQATLLLLEDALWMNDRNKVRQLLPHFLNSFRTEPLLFVPMGAGGHPHEVLQASRAQTILRALVGNLPRLGLLPETIVVMRQAYEMERSSNIRGQRVTEFDRLFLAALQASTSAVLDAVDAEDHITDERLLDLLQRLVTPYLPIWTNHSRSLRVSALEMVANEEQWQALVQFIRRYGRDIFHVRFLTLRNIRAVLHRGPAEYIRYLEENPDPLQPVRLIDDLGRAISLAQVEQLLGIILQALIENYDVYKDYNSTSPQSDYGDNLYLLLEFLRLKSVYDRQAWQLKPLICVHELLVKHRPRAAQLWYDRFAKVTQPIADALLGRLGQIEQTYGIQLTTVRDRLQEKFVYPLALDRLCALVEPAMEAADGHDGSAALEALEREIQLHAATPTGVGLDIPMWLQRFGATVHQIRASRSALAELAEEVLRIGKAEISFAELEKQWENVHIPQGEDAWRILLDLLKP